ncbi:MAG: hypothetical protein K2P26_05605 [Oscillospiraceae bacterium]|nr:hypothetical protein [Oscillospiraceae bacterium]
MDTGPVNDLYAFRMVDTPHPVRTPGWPSMRRSWDWKSGPLHGAWIDLPPGFR